QMLEDRALADDHSADFVPDSIAGLSEAPHGLGVVVGRFLRLGLGGARHAQSCLINVRGTLSILRALERWDISEAPRFRFRTDRLDSSDNSNVAGAGAWSFSPSLHQRDGFLVL